MEQLNVHHAPPARTRARGRAAVLIGLGVLLLAAATAWSLNAWVFSAHLDRGRQALLGQAARRAAHARTTPGACTSAAAPTSGALGLLSAPAIGLVAPVEQGLSDPVLAVAVGHDPTSVWPGVAGTAVFAAHDVSYFVDADHLDPGALLAYETPCTTYDFTVTGHKVVAAGSAVYNTPGPSLVLVTCWPTDALWFTPDRLLVTATETRVVPTTGSAPAAGAGYSPPRVAAPVALVAEGLTLATNDIPMGTMTLAGSPDPAFVQSPGPLDVEQSALEAFIGGAKALAGGERGWWDALAPGVAEPEGLVGAQLGGYSGGLDVTITVAGGDPQAVELTSEVTVSGGRAPGSYALRVAEVVHDGSLRIASWHLDAP